MLEIKTTTVVGMKRMFGGLMSRPDMPEERVSGLEDMQ